MGPMMLIRHCTYMNWLWVKSNSARLACCTRCCASPEWCCSCQVSGREVSLAYSASATCTRTPTLRSSTRAGPCMVQLRMCRANTAAMYHPACPNLSHPEDWTMLMASAASQGMNSFTATENPSSAMAAQYCRRAPRAKRHRLRYRLVVSESGEASGAAVAAGARRRVASMMVLLRNACSDCVTHCSHRSSGNKRPSVGTTRQLHSPPSGALAQTAPDQQFMRARCESVSRARLSRTDAFPLQLDQPRTRTHSGERGVKNFTLPQAWKRVNPMWTSP